jgi:hypothetical protein
VGFGTKTFAVVVSLVLVGTTLEPLLRQPYEDGFPLSTYAMFAFPHATKLTMEYAIGVTRTGERRPMPPWAIGSGEVLQALVVFTHAKDAHVLPELCAEIAVRVAGYEPYADITEIRIITGTHDAVDYLVRHVTGPETIRTTCKVMR